MCYPDLQSGSLCGRRCPERRRCQLIWESWWEGNTQAEVLQHSFRPQSVRSWAPPEPRIPGPVHPSTPTQPLPTGTLLSSVSQLRDQEKKVVSEARCPSSTQLKMKISQLKFGSVQLSANFHPCLWRGSAVHWLKVWALSLDCLSYLPVWHLTDYVTLDRLFNSLCPSFLIHKLGLLIFGAHSWLLKLLTELIVLFAKVIKHRQHVLFNIETPTSITCILEKITWVNKSNI